MLPLYLIEGLVLSLRGQLLHALELTLVDRESLENDTLEIAEVLLDKFTLGISTADGTFDQLVKEDLKLL